MRYQTKLLRESKFFSEKFITEFADSVDWDLFSCNCDVSAYSIEFFERFKNDIKWHCFDWCSNVNHEFLLKFKDDISPGNFCDFFELTHGSDYSDPEEVKIIKEVRDVFLEKYSDLFEWEMVSSMFPFSMEEMKKYEDKIDWEQLVWNENLTEEMAIKYKEKIKMAFEHSDKNQNHDYVYKVFHSIDSYSHELVYTFIKDIEDLPDDEFERVWNIISDYAILTKEFIIEYKEYLDLETVMRRICNHKFYAEREKELLDKGEITDSGLYYNTPKEMELNGQDISYDFVNEIIIPAIFKKQLSK